MVRRFLFLACLAAASGCDRAVLDDPVGASLLTVAPDLGVVQIDSSLTLRLRASEFSGPLAVQVGARPVPFDSAEGAFVTQITLARGLNALPVAVTDDAGETERDTLYAVYLPIRPAPVAGLADATPRADAAAAPLAPDRWIISGGSDADGRALDSADDLTLSTDGQLQTRTVTLQTARTGHTATPLDGGVLLLGGTTTDAPDSRDSFVPDGEWIGPDGRTVRIAIEGGLLRTRHTARALPTESGTVVYVYGGLSGESFTPTGTVDVYRVDRSDTDLRLVRLSPTGGSGAFPVLADHLQIETGALSAAVRGLAPDEPVGFSFAWSRPGTATYPLSLRAEPARFPLATPRTRAAAVDLGAGLALVVGGESTSGDPISTLEVFSTETGRSFRVPASVPLQMVRVDPVATFLGGGRIVVFGGRAAGGAVISGPESFQL